MVMEKKRRKGGRKNGNNAPEQRDMRPARRGKNERQLRETGGREAGRIQITKAM